MSAKRSKKKAGRSLREARRDAYIAAVTFGYVCGKTGQRLRTTLEEAKRIYDKAKL